MHHLGIFCCMQISVRWQGRAASRPPWDQTGPSWEATRQTCREPSSPHKSRQTWTLVSFLLDLIPKDQCYFLLECKKFCRWLTVIHWSMSQVPAPPQLRPLTSSHPGVGDLLFRLEADRRGPPLIDPRPSQAGVPQWLGPTMLIVTLLHCIDPKQRTGLHKHCVDGVKSTMFYFGVPHVCFVLWTNCMCQV